MDDTLTDFEGSCRKLFGEHFAGPKVPEVEKAAAIRQHPTFWSHMPWMRDGRVLWLALEPLQPHLLSAYATWDEEGSIRGKYHWAATWLRLPPAKVHLVTRKEKARFAQVGPGPNILIDNYAKNVHEWREAGGIGILHTSARESIAALQRLGVL